MQHGAQKLTKSGLELTKRKKNAQIKIEELKAKKAAETKSTLRTHGQAQAGQTNDNHGAGKRSSTNLARMRHRFCAFYKQTKHNFSF